MKVKVSPEGEISTLLRAWSDGDEKALDKLAPPRSFRKHRRDGESIRLTDAR